MEQFIIQTGAVYIIGWLIILIFDTYDRPTILNGILIVCPIIYFRCGVSNTMLFWYIGVLAGWIMMGYLLYQIWLGMKYISDG